MELHVFILRLVGSRHEQIASEATGLVSDRLGGEHGLKDWALVNINVGG
jgi:hypothetical protein